MSWTQIHAILADPAAQTIASLIPIAWAVIAFCTKFVWKKKGWLGAFLSKHGFISKHDFIMLSLIEGSTALGYALYDALSAPASKVHSRLVEPDRLAIFMQTFIELTKDAIIVVFIYILLVICVKTYFRHIKTIKHKNTVSDIPDERQKTRPITRYKIDSYYEVYQTLPSKEYRTGKSRRRERNDDDDRGDAGVGSRRG